MKHFYLFFNTSLDLMLRGRGGAKARPRRDWGGEDDEDEEDYQPVVAGRGRGRPQAGGRRPAMPQVNPIKWYNPFVIILYIWFIF